jgi:hypothetical protein
MKTLGEITIEMDLLFARLFKMDDKVETLEQLVFGGLNLADDQLNLDSSKLEQKQIVFDLKTVSSEYWKTL